MKFKKLLYLAIFLSLMMSCKESVNIDLGNKYRLKTDQNYELFVVHGDNEPYTVILDGQILSFGFDENFILASQRPRDSVKSSNNNRRTWIFDKEFKNSNFKQYWIIDKTQNSKFSWNSITKKGYSNIYGPFKEKEFLMKKVELKIAKDIRLKDIKY